MNCLKLHYRAILPGYGTDGAAGLDLYAIEDETIPQLERRTVPTGLSIELPDGTYGAIWPRSGMAVSRGAMVMAGVIDPDYRGEIRVVIYNSGDAPIEIRAGDRIAQLIVQPYVTTRPRWVDALATTTRGAGGFGSTGR